MDADQNIVDADESISPGDFQDPQDDDEIVPELQITQYLSKYDGGYDSQACIGGELENPPVSEVSHIVCTEDIVFAVWNNQATVTAFQRNSRNMEICEIEATQGQELIVNIAYNVNDDSLLVLKKPVVSRDIIRSQFDQLLSFKIESVKNGDAYPGSKHIDDCLDYDVPNNRALGYDYTREVFIIYDLIDFQPKFELPDIGDLQLQSDQKNSYMTMFNRNNRSKHTMAPQNRFLPTSVVPAFFYSKKDGKAKHEKAVELPLKQTGAPLEFLLLMEEKVVLSQSNRSGFLIVDVSIDGINNFPLNIIRTDIESDTVPRYLSRTHEFFTFKLWETVRIYNFDGELVRNLDDHCVAVKRTSSNPTTTFNSLSYVTSDEEIIISYCHSAVGSSINISSLRTGKCLGKIANEKLDSEVITFLTYDEERSEIFTGTADGSVHRWLNRFINPTNPAC